MLALITTSVGSGQIISRTGRYRWALLLGPVLMAAGFVLLSGLDVGSTDGDATLAMVVVGLGLGLLLQNLVLAVQNGVPTRFLGAATSTGQFFRSIGGTVGVTAMGAILAGGLHSTGAGTAPPAQLADAIHPVFMLGVPLMALTFAIVWLIPEVPLRRSVHDEPAPALIPDPRTAPRETPPARRPGAPATPHRAPSTPSS
jgi:MFS family permease